MVSAAYENEATILVLNRKDNVLEVVTTSSTPWQQVLWTVEYSGDHYTPVQHLAPETIQALCPLFNFQPWIARPGDLKGGSQGRSMWNEDSHAPGPQMKTQIGLRTRTRPGWKLAQLRQQRRRRHGHAKIESIPDPGHALIATWNIAAWRTRELDLVAYLERNQPKLLLLQEVKIDERVQARIQKLLGRHGYGIIFGAPTPRIPNSKGRMRLDIGKVPGVACIYHLSTQVVGESPLTPSGQSLWKQGRLHVISIALSTGVRVRIYNHYGPSAPERSDERDQYYKELMQEIVVSPDPVIVGGDWNLDPRNISMVATLQSLGWLVPEWIDIRGQPTQVTYELGGAKTLLDGFVISPKLSSPGYTQTVRRWPGTAHAIVESALPALDSCEQHRIPYPPRLEPKKEKQAYDWEWAKQCVQSLMSEQKCSPKPKQEYIDLIWGAFWTALREYMAATHSIQGKGSFKQLGRPPEQRQQSQANPARNHVQRRARTALQAVHRLQSLARQEGNEQKILSRLEKQQGEISEALGLSEEEWRQAMLNPEWAMPNWIEKMRNLRISDYRRAIREWLNTITQKARPTGALYRWLKGTTPHPSLTIKFQGTLWKGPAKFFAAVRMFWTQIMCEDPGERTALQHFCNQQVPEKGTIGIEAMEALKQAIASIMKPTAAAGLDMWPVTCVKALPQEGRLILLQLYQISEEEACWPTQVHDVRTHLIPKPQSNSTSHTLLEPAALRPIAIISVWLRLWSKWRLVMLGPRVHTTLSQSLRGGIPGRTMYPNMLELLLACEEAMLEPTGPPFLCLSVDASKCFDRIRPTQALSLAAKHGLDTRTLRGIASFNLQLQRRFSCATELDAVGLTPTNGLLQGDPLSVLLCNLCIQDWHLAVTTENQPVERMGHIDAPPSSVTTCAFIDDRTMVSSSYASLQQAWRKSVAWDKKTSWKVNVDKTHMMAVRAKQQERVGEDDGQIQHVQQLCVLGHEIAKAYSAGGQIQKKRTTRACTSARRLSQLSLCPAVSQRVLAAAILPKFAFGIQHRPVPKQATGALKNALKQALGLQQKANAWEALCLYVFPGHQIDPEVKSFYTHAMAICQALQEGTQELLASWTRTWQLPQGHIPKGPVGTLQNYFQRFRITTDLQGLIWKVQGLSDVAVRTAPRKILGHFLRHAAKNEWTRQLAEKRQNMQGIIGQDIKLTAAITRKEGHLHRRFLIPIVTDAVWTMARRARCHLCEDDQCPWCPNTTETLLHLWFFCPRWDSLRGPIREYSDQIMASPRCTSHCFIATHDMPEALRKRWGAIQIAAAQIYRARMDAQPPESRRKEKTGDEAGVGPPSAEQVPVVVPPRVGGPYPFEYTERLH